MEPKSIQKLGNDILTGSTQNTGGIDDQKASHLPPAPTPGAQPVQLGGSNHLHQNGSAKCRRTETLLRQRHDRACRQRLGPLTIRIALGIEGVFRRLTLS